MDGWWKTMDWPGMVPSPRLRGMSFGLLYGHTPRTIPEALQCNKIIHVGWIGLDVNCKIGGLLNFIVGWTTFSLDKWQCFGSGNSILRPPEPAK